MSSNRLAREKSPYLLQHAHNPVDWFAWGEEAFAKARRENKPIFLSIGYSTCHWCHVMEHESFESAAIAAFLSEHFISIKVDREERPDVDQVYMAFVQATTGQRRLAHERLAHAGVAPFLRRHLLSAHRRPGRPGFITILRRVAELWKMERDQIEAKAGSLLSALREAESEAVAQPNGEWDTSQTLRLAISQYSRMFDPEEGGFGGAPKFPRPVNLQFLLHLAAQKDIPARPPTPPAAWPFTPCAKWPSAGCTITSAAASTATPSMPNGTSPILRKCSTTRPSLPTSISPPGSFPARTSCRTARNILHYVAHDLTSPEGGFHSAEDADSLPRAGRRVKPRGLSTCGPATRSPRSSARNRLDEFCAVYGVEPEGNVSAASDPHGELGAQRPDPAPHLR